MTGMSGRTPQQTMRSEPAVPVHAVSVELLEEKKRTVRITLHAVEERNRVIESFAARIDWVYQGLSPVQLHTLPPVRCQDYRTYAVQESVYVIDHPPYALFFHAQKPRAVMVAGDLRSSLVDDFLKSAPDTTVALPEQEQPKMEWNFMLKMRQYVRIHHLPPLCRDLILQNDAAMPPPEMAAVGDRRGKNTSSMPAAVITPAVAVAGIGIDPVGCGGNYAL